jgi:hypothetical protein
MRWLLEQIVQCIESFFNTSDELTHKVYNEAALQHELGYWLRLNLPTSTRIQFERPANYFYPEAHSLVKKEIDIVVSIPEANKHYAIELKCPRQGQHPEQMFKASQDLQFLEQLVHSGFAGGIFIIHVVHPLFYQNGSSEGIYGHFRAGRPLEGIITKPTGAKDQVASLKGCYHVTWQTCSENGRYWIQPIQMLSE